MIKLIKRLWPEDEAQDVVEYALLLMLLAATATTAMKGVAHTVDKIYSHASTNVVTAGSSASVLGGGAFDLNSSTSPRILNEKMRPPKGR